MATNQETIPFLAEFCDRMAELPTRSMTQLTKGNALSYPTALWHSLCDYKGVHRGTKNSIQEYKK